MENNSQSNPQVSTPSTHSEGKVLMIAVLMFIFGGVMGNMIPGMSGIQQKGASLDSNIAQESVKVQDLVRNMNMNNNTKVEFCENGIILNGECTRYEDTGIIFVEDLSSVVRAYLDDPVSFVNTSVSNTNPPTGSTNLQLPSGYSCNDYSNSSGNGASFSCFCSGNSATTIGSFLNFPGQCSYL